MTSFDGLDRQVRDLKGSVGDLGSDLRSLRERIERLEGRHRDLGEHLENAQSDIDDLRGDLENLDTTVTELGIASNHLDRRADWLEHHVRDLAQLPVVGLDDSDSHIAGLTARVRDQQDAVAKLLPDDDRAGLEEIVAAYETIKSRRLALLQESDEHMDNFTNTHPGDGDDDPREDFHRVDHRLESVNEELQRARLGFETASKRLANNQRAHDNAKPTIEAGQIAGAELTAIMRQRIEDAMVRYELMPRWFTTTFAYRPPDDPDRWLSVASEVVIYRLAYNVQDADRPLGDLPTEAAWPQRDWHRDLINKIRVLR